MTLSSSCDIISLPPQSVAIPSGPRVNLVGCRATDPCLNNRNASSGVLKAAAKVRVSAGLCSCQRCEVGTFPCFFQLLEGWKFPAFRQRHPSPACAFPWIFCNLLLRIPLGAGAVVQHIKQQPAALPSHMDLHPGCSTDQLPAYTHGKAAEDGRRGHPQGKPEGAFHASLAQPQPLQPSGKGTREWKISPSANLPFK